MKIRIATLAALSVLGCAAVAAHATPLIIAVTTTTYNFNGTLVTGGAVTGTVTVVNTGGTYTFGPESFTVVAPDATYMVNGPYSTYQNDPTGYVEDQQSSPDFNETVSLIFPEPGGVLSLTPCTVANPCAAPYTTSLFIEYGPHVTIAGPFQPQVPPMNANYNLQTGSLSPQIPPSAVPEPSSLMLLGTGIVGLAGAVRRRFSKV